MRVKSISLENFRAFISTGVVNLDQINVLVGPNNAGKSSIIRGLQLLQTSPYSFFPDVRAGSIQAKLMFSLEGSGDIEVWKNVGLAPSFNLKIELRTGDRVGGAMHIQTVVTNHAVNLPALPDREPHHFIVPLLSKRKTGHYQEDVKNENVLKVAHDMSYLSAKLARLANPGFPAYKKYADTCQEVLGFLVTSVPSQNGHRPGIYLPDRTPLYIDQMGEGVPHLVSFLADLALSTKKLFLIEEPENDLHPMALKALLDLIVDSSEHNQFVISTHSNIVVRHLGANKNCRLFNVTTAVGTNPPAAEISVIAATSEARLKVLQDLGYSFSDFDLWDGWLILEEASAERIIRDYLIPWFIPKLSRIRTVAAKGVDEVAPTFRDFERMIRYTHLEEIYRNRAWVRVDAGARGRQIINELRENYKIWPPERFDCYQENDFENYYPGIFKERVKETLGIADRQAKRAAKQALLSQVRSWLDENVDRGKEALSISAGEIIADLRRIEQQLFK